MGKITKPRVYETMLFIALLSGPPRFRTRDTFDSLSGVVDWSVLLSAGVWALGAIWVFLNLGGHVLNRRSVPSFSAIHVLAFLFVGSLYLSTFASLAPTLTFYRVSQILIAILFCYFWVRRFGVDSTLKHLLAGYVTMSLAIAVAAIVAPDLVYTYPHLGGEIAAAEGEARRLRGDLITNTGYVTALGIILALSYPVVRIRALYLGILALFFVLLALSLTRGAYVVVAAFGLLAFIRSPENKPLRYSIYLSVYTLLTLIPAALLLQLTWVTSKLSAWMVREPGSLGTLSARIPLWQYVLSESLEESPWIGVGFYANRMITTEFLPGLGTSHSAYVEVFSGGGILGITTFGMMLVALVYLTARLFLLRGKDPRVFAAAGLLLDTLLIGILSEEMIIASPTSFTFWALLSLMPMLFRMVPSPAEREVNGVGRQDSRGPRPLPAIRR